MLKEFAHKITNETIEELYHCKEVFEQFKALLNSTENVDKEKVNKALNEAKTSLKDTLIYQMKISPENTRKAIYLICGE